VSSKVWEVHNNNSDQVAIVTGAAGGMGSASTRLLAEQGWSLILCDLPSQGLDDVADLARQSASQVEVLAGSVADSGFSNRLIDTIGERAVGAVIHTAGLSPTMGDAAQIFAVNYDATAQLIEVVRPRMAEGACAVLISSSSAFAVIRPEFDAAINAIGPGEDSSSLLSIAPDANFAYPLSKRGVQLMVEKQAMAFGARHARIVSISPGLIDTRMGRAEQKAHPQMDIMLENSPLQRYGTADEIASAAVFLC